MANGVLGSHLANVVCHVVEELEPVSASVSILRDQWVETIVMELRRKMILATAKNVLRVRFKIINICRENKEKPMDTHSLKWWCGAHTFKDGYTHLQESISPTFYARIFCTKVLRKIFLFLDFRFVLFWRKNIGAKASRILLMKLTPGSMSG